MDNLDMSKAECWDKQDTRIHGAILGEALIDYGSRMMRLSIHGAHERASMHLSFPSHADTTLKLKEYLVRRAADWGLELCYTDIEVEY
jgi:hypothetical protein